MAEPFQGARLLVDEESLAAQWRHKHRAAWLDPIAATPQARWLTGPDDLYRLPSLLDQARRQRALPVVVAYYIPGREMTRRDGTGQGAPDPTAYRAWIAGLVSTLGAQACVVILEPDAIADDGFDDARAATIAPAARALSAAGHHVYLDAGHPRWRSPDEMAQRLSQAGIADAQGFSVNVSNRQPTAQCQRFAAELSALVGDREAVIDTSRNGLPAPADDEWCNPANQGLGEPPTTEPDLDRVAALLWVKRPGESDGACGTEATDEVFSVRQAQTLIANAPWLPPTARQAAKDANLPAA
jgi:endoglucanase